MKLYDCILHISCAAILWGLLIPATAMLYTVTLTVTTLLTLPWWLHATTTKTKPSWEICRENADAIETHFVSENFPHGATSDWISLLKTGHWHAHRVYVPCQGPSIQPRTLLLVHGTGSSATLLSSSCVHDLSQHFNLHIVDLPGFGRTPCPPDAVIESAGDCIDIMADFFDLYCMACNLNNFIIAAHSAGAYFSLQWLITRPSRLRNVYGCILISSGGYLPTFSDFGAYFALLSTLRIPSCSARRFGQILYPLARNSPYLQLWLQVNANTDVLNFSPLFCRMSSGSAIWTQPCLPDFLHTASTSPKFVLLTGSKDHFTCWHESFMISRLASLLGIQIPFMVIPGAGHSCFHLKNGKLITSAIIQATTTLDNLHLLRQTHIQTTTLSPFRSALRVSDWKSAHSSFSPSVTHRTRKRLYKRLIETAL